ncbi:MAG: metallophosphoesterase [Vulcanimicrobiota bacterium]
MLVGVMSDSHDHLDRLRLAVRQLRDRKVELLLHAGDFISPFSVPILNEMGCPIRAVFGNNDGEKVGLKARFSAFGHEVQERPFAYEFQGRRFLLLHEPVALDTLAGCAEYDLVVYGHTHEVEVRHPEHGALLLNPGEVCGWLTERPTCAVVDLARRHIEILDLASNSR